MRYKNNPFNIRYNHLNHWKGLLGNDNGFCKFMSLNYGIRTAAYLLMISYRRRGKRTYAELIETFAPSLENPTFQYVKFVTDHLGKFPFDVPESRKDFASMLYYMWWFEQGQKPDFSPIYILNVIRLENVAVWKPKK